MDIEWQSIICILMCMRVLVHTGVSMHVCCVHICTSAFVLTCVHVCPCVMGGSWGSNGHRDQREGGLITKTITDSSSVRTWTRALKAVQPRWANRL